MPGGQAWPRISIVTPSYNQASFLEETIRSVLLQGYPDLEYIVIDGGSNDGSADTIRKYQDWLTFWVSEPDDGQADAINKGFAMSTGDNLAWLNSDDTYEPGSLLAVAECFARHPEAQLVYGDLKLTDLEGKVIDLLRSVPVTLGAALHDGCNQGQPTSFWKRAAFLEYGPLDARLYYAMEYDFFYKLLSKEKAVYLRRYVAALRIHSQTKTSLGREAARREKAEIMRRYLGEEGWSKYPWRWCYGMRRYLLYVRQGDLGYLMRRLVRRLRRGRAILGSIPR